MSGRPAAITTMAGSGIRRMGSEWRARFNNERIPCDDARLHAGSRSRAFGHYGTYSEEVQVNSLLLLRSALLCAALAILPTAVSVQAKTPPKDAVIYIAYPEDGATETGAFLCRFGLRNMGIAPAGHDFPNTGHHHLLVDTAEPINTNEPIPHDKKHLHFGGGETEMLLDLPPGKHTLQLVLGDGNHVSFDPPLLSKKITITVKGEDGDNDRVRKQSKHRIHHRIHEAKQVEAKPKKEAEACPSGLWGWIKGCHDAASTPVKPLESHAGQ